MSDLSLYSISGENENNLSDLYNLLDDDSIEIGRLGDSKISSPIRSSPTRKLTNDYFTHLTSVRSPMKPLRVDLNLFDNDSGNKIRGGHDTFETIERNIDKYIKNNINGSSSNNGSDPLGSNPFFEDDSHLLIQESHKLINEIPLSIDSNQEGEKHIKLLRSCIEKALKTIVTQQNQITKLNRSNGDLKLQVTQLISSQEQLRQQSSKLQALSTTLSQKNAQLKQTINDYEIKLLQQNGDEENGRLKQENSLLREKLIKYKNLYESKIDKSHDDGANDEISPARPAKVAEKPPSYQKLLDLFEMMLKQQQEDKQPHKEKRDLENEKNRGATDNINANDKEDAGKENKNMSGSDLNNISRKNDDAKNKHTKIEGEANANELFEKIDLGQKKHKQDGKIIHTHQDNDIIDSRKSTPSKKPCQVCNSDTLHISGEFKWTI